MKFIAKGPFLENIYNLMRNIGYHFQREDKEKKELTFVSSLGSDSYPRFHIYLKIEDENLVINLHLDQKKPTYKGTAAHGGEYQGKAVEKEAERIKIILRQNTKK